MEKIFILSSALFLHLAIMPYVKEAKSGANLPSFCKQHPVLFFLLVMFSFFCAISVVVWSFFSMAWYMPIIIYIAIEIIFYFLNKSTYFNIFSTSALCPIVTALGQGLLAWKVWI